MQKELYFLGLLSISYSLKLREQLQIIIIKTDAKLTYMKYVE